MFALVFGTSLGAQGSRDGAHVLARHLQRLEWLVSGDSARLDAALHPDVRVVHSNGLVQHKADILSDIRTKHLEYFVIAPSDSSVRTVGSGTAIVSGRMRVKGAINGTPYKTELLYTETWLKTGARWRLVARHASRAPER